MRYVPLEQLLAPGASDKVEDLRLMGSQSFQGAEVVSARPPEQQQQDGLAPR
jgi:hypothetical protein